MLKDMTRSKVIQVWFAAVALIAAAAFAFGVTMTIGTGAMLLALSLVPPGIVVMLWPVTPAPTIAEVLHGTDRRG